MIGQLGATSVASVALANQVGFLLTLTLFGISSGAAVFSAQFWGKEDVPSIHKVLGICLTLAFSVACVFALIAEFIPTGAMSLYTQDQTVIELGARYLQIAGLSYLFTSISVSYAAVLKGMGLVRLPMVVSVTALSLKAFLKLRPDLWLFRSARAGDYGRRDWHAGGAGGGMWPDAAGGLPTPHRRPRHVRESCWASAGVLQFPI